MKKIQGFSLIELMISVVIVGILVLVGLPTYRQSVLRANRTDAKITLHQLAALQEQYYFRENQYTDDFADILDSAASGGPAESNEGHYSVTVITTGNGSGWVMTAIARDAQLDDTDCRTLSLDNLGIRTATNAEGNANDEECWK